MLDQYRCLVTLCVIIRAIMIIVTSYTALYLILLTYKGKVLLLQQENILDSHNDNEWHFIEKSKTKDKLAEKTIIEEVFRETQLKLDGVTLLSKELSSDTIHYLFHARLNDKHVNSIERAEGRVLQFFSIPELSKLKIQSATKSFFQKNRALIEHLSISQ